MCPRRCMWTRVETHFRNWSHIGDWRRISMKGLTHMSCGAVAPSGRSTLRRFVAWQGCPSDVLHMEGEMHFDVAQSVAVRYDGSDARNAVWIWGSGRCASVSASPASPSDHPKASRARLSVGHNTTRLPRPIRIRADSLPSVDTRSAHHPAAAAPPHTRPQSAPGGATTWSAAAPSTGA